MVDARQLRSLEQASGELLERHDTRTELSEFGSFADGPAGFVEDVLHGSPWRPGQGDIFDSVRDSPLTAVHTGHAVGKDWAAAALALWWVYARRGLAIIQGPTQRQVREICMGEVGRLFHAAQDLPGELFTTALRLGRDEQAGILAFTSTEASRLTGFHAPRVLVIITEAQAVEPFVYEAALSVATGAEDRILAVGNPTEPSGKFYSICRPESDWNVVHIGCEEHPNLVEGRTVIPGGPSREYVERIASEYGRDGDIYRSRVDGLFPRQASSGLVRREWLEDAHEAYVAGAFAAQAAAERPVVGVDPARFGNDRTAMAVRRGPVLSRLTTWAKLDTVETAERVATEVDGLEPFWERGPDSGKRIHAKGEIVVDAFGQGGGVIDVLRSDGFKVHEFWGWNDAHDNRRCANLRASSYWHTRKLLEDRSVAIEWDDALAEELLAVRYRPTPSGLIQLEPKEELRKRLGRSPDRADAVTMAFHHGTGPRWTMFDAEEMRARARW